MPVVGPEPVVALGTVVRAALSGWDEGCRGCDPEVEPDAPDLSGHPRFVEGPLSGWYAEELGYFKHVVSGQLVDPSTIAVLDRPAVDGESLAWKDPALLWPDEPVRRKRYRALQSWYRHNVLAVPPGVHSSGRPLGSLLPEWAGEAGLNFLHSGVHAYVKERVPQVLAENGALARPRLMTNMLSSMPLAFNLFGHLRAWPGIAADVIREMLGVPVSEIRRIEVEYAPQPVERYLGDRTAFDAFVEYSSKGRRGFIAIETKYTEPFTQVPHVNNPRYAELTSAAHGFREGALERVSQVATNQLWRNTMLALALRQLDEFDEAYVAVFSTADDEAAKAAVAGLREELGEAGLVLPLVNFERFIEPLDAYVGASTFAREFSLRYLDLTPVA
jgi:hypothetical protein